MHIYIYMYIYIYIYIYHPQNTPPERSTHWNISPQGTESGAGEQFLLLDCSARACAKGVVFSQTPVSKI